MSGNGKRSLKPVTPRESLEEKMARFQRTRDSVGVDWSKIPQAELKGAIVSCVGSGAALMFSAASGGRGVCLTVFADNDKAKMYAIDADELTSLFGGLIDMFGSGAEDVRQAVV